jgi:uncharacterized protein YPO0396
MDPKKLDAPKQELIRLSSITNDILMELDNKYLETVIKEKANKITELESKIKDLERQLIEERAKTKI